MLNEHCLNSIFDQVAPFFRGCIEELSEGTSVVALMQKGGEWDTPGGVLIGRGPAIQRVRLGLLGMKITWRGPKERPGHYATQRFRCNPRLICSRFAALTLHGIHL